MENLSIQKANPGHSEQAGALLLDTLYGFGPYMLGLGSRERALRVLADFFRLPGNRFSHEFSYIAEIDGKVAGLLLVFPGALFTKVNWAMIRQIPKVYSLREICEFIRREVLLRDEEEVGRDEFYVAHLSVNKDFQRKGIGNDLLKSAVEKAREHGLKKLSLMAEQENTDAIRLYERFGFRTVKTFVHPHQLPLTGSPAYVRMVMDIKQE